MNFRKYFDKYKWNYVGYARKTIVHTPRDTTQKSWNTEHNVYLYENGFGERKYEGFANVFEIYEEYGNWLRGGKLPDDDDFKLPGEE